MRIAVLMRCELIARITELARRAGRSRNHVFTVALSEYLARHEPAQVTETMDRVCAEVGDHLDAFVATAGTSCTETDCLVILQP
jgi:metal-responsive CopG/Arc/MetJ family transcriptional regulator